MGEPADSLIAACLGAQSAETTVRHAVLDGVPPAEKAELWSTALSLYDAITPVLHSRRASCTLVGSALRATELAFALAYGTLHLTIHRIGRAQGKAMVLFYETYLMAAHQVLIAQEALEQNNTVAPPAFSLKQRRYDFVASAADVLRCNGQDLFNLRLPRIEYTSAESILFSSIRLMVEHDFCSPDSLAAASRLIAAWNQLLQSRLFAGRNFDEQQQVTRQLSERKLAELAAEASERGLRTCALAGCAAREVHARQFKLCAACQTVVYCGRAHQQEDWPSHKAACKAARKAAASAPTASTSGA